MRKKGRQRRKLTFIFSYIRKKHIVEIIFYLFLNLILTLIFDICCFFQIWLDSGDFIIVVDDKLEVCFILMLCTHSLNKFRENFIKVSYFRILLISKVKEYSWVDTGDIIENRFCEVHFPFIFPGICDIV